MLKKRQIKRCVIDVSFKIKKKINKYISMFIEFRNMD